MYLHEEKRWPIEIRNEITENLKEYLSLYLFKGNVSDVEYAIENLFNLETEELNALKAAHFLLSDELNQFIKVLPFLIRNLAHSTQKEKVEYKGLIRGKVDWNQTYKTRYSKGFNDKSLFVCMPSSKSYDLEENQLLKFMLKKVIFLFENILSFIKKSDAELEYEDLDIYEKDNHYTNEEKNWHDIVTTRYYLAKKALKNIYFDNISDLKYINPKILRKTKNHRNNYYKKLAILYELYEKLFIYGNDEESKTIFKDLIEKQLLKPASDDTLFELFIFFNLVDYLPEPKRLGLLVYKNDYSVESEIDDVKVKIYYQEVPKDVFSKFTKYKKIFENYDIGVNLRRPDVLIEFEKEGKKHYRIIEVKRTSSPDYIRDSVYKVLGYLNDFEGVPFTEKVPGVIACWEGVQMDNKSSAFNQDVLILNKKDFLNNLDELFSME